MREDVATSATLLPPTARPPLPGLLRTHGARVKSFDVSHDVGADVVCDLAEHPWPFPDDSFSEVHATDIIEHLPDTLRAFEEIHRVCRKGARVLIAVPHFSCVNAYADPTHRKFFTYQTFDFLTSATDQPHYTRAEFKILRRTIVFDGPLRRLAWQFAKRWPHVYERRLAFLYPAHFLSVELEVVK
jgi:SAM-dependent methyltransferase